METEKLIAALREDAKILGSSGHGYGGMAGTNRRAADLLECQQARIAEVDAQLAESQRREQAAVADIEKMMRICEKGSCHFCANGDCTEAPLCSPKWRGPQEAEEGGQ